jgi:hypothetical protein
MTLTVQTADPLLTALRRRAALLASVAADLDKALAGPVDADPLTAARWLTRLDRQAHKVEDLADEVAAATPESAA